MFLHSAWELDLPLSKVCTVKSRLLRECFNFLVGQKAGKEILSIISNANIHRHAEEKKDVDVGLTDKEKIDHYLMFSSSMVSKVCFC